jgi:hypothetical protein
LEAVPDQIPHSHAFFFKIWLEESGHMVAVSCYLEMLHYVIDPVASNAGMNEVIHMSFFLLVVGGDL